MGKIELQSALNYLQKNLNLQTYYSKLLLLTTLKFLKIQC